MPLIPTQEGPQFNPDELNAAHIQAIGDEYLKLHGKSDHERNSCVRLFDSMFHHNQPTANQLKQYPGSDDVYKNWIFLADTVLNLKKANGEIFDAIMQLFQTAFKNIDESYLLVHDANDHNQYIGSGTKEVISAQLKMVADNFFINQYRRDLLSTPNTSSVISTTVNSPNDISNHIIQSLGVAYLQAHPTEPKGCVGFLSKMLSAHTNQPTATKLSIYDANSSDYDKWIFLAKAYAGLEFSHGELSSAILQQFEKAFGKSVHTFQNYGSTSPMASYESTQYFHPQMVSNALIGIVKQHYHHECRVHLNLEARAERSHTL